MCTRDLQSKIDTLTEYTLFLNAGVTKLTNDEKGHSSSCTNKPEVEIEECIQIISMIPKSFLALCLFIECSLLPIIQEGVHFAP